MPPTTIIKRNGEAVPFDTEKITVAIYKARAAGGAHDRELAEGLTRLVVAALDAAYSGEQLPTVEDTQDFVERVLIQGGHTEVAKRYILYRGERAQMRSRRRRERVEPIPYKAMWQALDWAVEHGCNTVAGLNQLIREGRLRWLIRAADELYERTLEQIAAAVLERHEELRFLIVAGPSSSGKSTTTSKLEKHLEAAGLSVVPLALDNYFFDLRLHPRDELGDYDFKTGNRLERTTPFHPAPGSVVLLDTLHGLYEGLTASVPDEHKCRLYIETISQLKTAEGRYMRWTDIRLLRRMIRDAKFRGYEPERTIQHWHYVRRSELKHIIPHQSRADFHINGALAYELPFLKLHLFHHFPDFIRRWQGDDRRLDGYIRARRIHDLLASIEDVADDSAVPETSLLREFIGGSAYDVH
jgi:uridine kinase